MCSRGVTAGITGCQFFYMVHRWKELLCCWKTSARNTFSPNTVLGYSENCWAVFVNVPLRWLEQRQLLVIPELLLSVTQQQQQKKPGGCQI